MKKFFFCFPIIVFLTACAATREQKTAEIEQSLAAAHGKGLGPAVAGLGPPHSTFELGKGRRGFQWVMTSQRPGMIMPIGNSLMVAPPQATICRITFTAITKSRNPGLNDWIIDGHAWAGRC